MARDSFSIPGYDAWKTRAPEDEPGYWDDKEPDEEDAPDEIESEVDAWLNRAMPRMASIHDSKRLYALLQKIGTAYPNDPGTSDLYDEQPVSLSVNLGDVRLAWRLLR